MSELVTAIELRRALVGALGELAPAGGGREVPLNMFCDALVALVADLLVAAGSCGTGDAEAERLVDLFRSKLEAAMAARGDGAVGHA